MSESGFLHDVGKIVGANGLIVDKQQMRPYLTDWRGLETGTALAVVRPTTTEQVSEVLKIASANGVAVVPQGGNTGLAYATVNQSASPSILLSMSRMNAVRAVDRVGMTMHVEAGCVLLAAKQAALAVGRQLPISLASEGSAQIGGVIAANAGGVNVVRHGMARDHVLGLEVVLADGTVVGGLRALRKDNAGYNWSQWFIGAEGTLGVVTAAILRLSPLPRHTVVAMMSVPSSQAALDLLALVQDELGDTIVAFELLADASLALVETHFGLKRPIAAAPWHVLIEAQSSVNGLREAFEVALAKAFESGLAQDGVLAESETQALNLWALREHITEAEQREGPSAKHDVSVPISSVPAFLERAQAAVAREIPGARFNPFGHLGDGNIHFNVLLPQGQLAKTANEIVHALVIDMGGSVSAEHGIGRYRRDALRQMRSPAELGLMGGLKKLLDPLGQMNPGAVLSSPQSDAGRRG
jgi:FAD/FMN-containing dehydrogenase